MAPIHLAVIAPYGFTYRHKTRKEYNIDLLPLMLYNVYTGCDLVFKFAVSCMWRNHNRYREVILTTKTKHFEDLFIRQPQLFTRRDLADEKIF
jgi:hypothetical protein